MENDANTVPLPPPLPALESRPLAGFFFDLMLAIILMVGLSIVGGVIWGVYRGFILIRAQGQALTTINADKIIELLGSPGALAMILITLFSSGGAALLVYFLRRLATAAERARSWQALAQLSTWGWIVLASISCLLFNSVAGWALEQFAPGTRPTNQAIIEAGYQQYPLFLTLFAVFLAPAYEELLFRRVLFGRLHQAARPWLGLLLSSLVFALLHEIPGVSGNPFGVTAVYWVIYLFMGACFAGVYWRTGSLWAAVITHALNNAVGLALMFWFGLNL